MKQEKKDLIQELAEKAAVQCDFEIYSLTVQFRKRSVKIDVRIDNGAVVSHTDCADYSRVFSAALEEEGSIEDFELEISSPGLKRKLRTVEECTRFSGAPVKITYMKEGNPVSIEGTLSGVEGRVLTVKTGKKKKVVAFEDIKSARLDY